MKCPLTIILTIDQEKEPRMVERFFRSMSTLQSGSASDVQIIAVIQGTKQLSQRESACRNCGLRVQIVRADEPSANGTPIWDVREEARQVWPMVRGRYVTWQHAEFFWLRNRLPLTLRWLSENDPLICIGNLLRPGANRKDMRWHREYYTPESCQQIISAIDKGKLDEADLIASTASLGCWVYWGNPEPAGDHGWREDIFFARRDWIESSGLLDCGPRLPFQDIFDLVGQIMRMSDGEQIKIPCPRMDRIVNAVVHLWHPRDWHYVNEHVRDHLLSDPETYGHTVLGRPEFWGTFEARASDPRWYEKFVHESRHAPNGTCRLFRDAIIHHLRNGGGESLRELIRSQEEPADVHAAVCS